MKKAIRQPTMTFLLNATSIILIGLSIVAFFFIAEANHTLDETNLTRYELYNKSRRFLECPTRCGPTPPPATGCTMTTISTR